MFKNLKSRQTLGATLHFNIPSLVPFNITVLMEPSNWISNRKAPANCKMLPMYSNESQLLKVASKYTKKFLVVLYGVDWIANVNYR